jgi:CheY-like chemotaxis protein/HPt (histidine-containing phosphotransfer) domain-containing protein
MLEKLGHFCFIVSNGQDAADAALSGEFDLVFMDVMMPDVDGIAATKEIRSLSEIYIVALTANAFKQHEEACRAAGMDDFVAKPVTIKSIAAAIERFCQRTSIVPKLGQMPMIFDSAIYQQLESDLDVESAAEIMHVFLRNCSERVETIAANLGSKPGVVINEAHAMKSSAANLGFMAMSFLAREIEQHGMAGRWSEVSKLVDELRECLAEARKLGEAYLSMKEVREEADPVDA